jgi:O-antigen/teichoic acid export membrane protein
VNLRRATITATTWSLLNQTLSVAVTFVITLILARLLDPAEFGQVGMLAIFLAVSNVLVEFGFVAALIQRQDTDDRDYSTVFWINIGLGAAAAGLLYGSSTWIAAFYQEPSLTILVRILSAGFLFTSMMVIQSTLAQKHLNFRLVFWVHTVSLVASGFVGITMALNGYGAMSLAVQSVCFAAFRCGMYWSLQDWRPALHVGLPSIRKLWGFSTRSLIAQIFTRLFDELDTVLIGKVFGAAELGYYTRAKRLHMIPSTIVGGAIGQALFPVLSRLQQDDRSFQRLYGNAHRAIALTIIPVFGLLALAGKPLILFLYTDKWSGSVLYFQLLCLGGFVYPLNLLGMQAISAKGRMTVFLNYVIINRLFLVGTLTIGVFYGILAFLFAFLVVRLVMLVLVSCLVERTSGYPLARQAATIALFVGYTAAAAAAAAAARLGLPTGAPWSELAVLGGVFALVYGLLLWVFERDLLAMLVREIRGVKAGRFGKR